MRIIGGEFRGRVLSPPMKKWPTRPTTDIAKEALYNILSNLINFEEVSFLDLFGGTGNHALEFLSRGSTDVTYVDNYMACIMWMKEAVTMLDKKDNCTIVKKDVRRFISSCTRSFDIIFADPPYALPWLTQIPDQVASRKLLSPDGILIIEHGSDVDLSHHPHSTQHRKYGQSVFSFFTNPEDGAGTSG